MMMAIVGAVVVVVQQELTASVQDRLRTIPGLEVQGVGPRGIAVVLESTDTGELRSVSENIESWEEVLDFQLALLNWENEGKNDFEIHE
jgi:nitrate reductase NapAB chaperone NapD